MLNARSVSEVEGSLPNRGTDRPIKPLTCGGSAGNIGNCKTLQTPGEDKAVTVGLLLKAAVKKTCHSLTTFKYNGIPYLAMSTNLMTWVHIVAQMEFDAAGVDVE